jgi:hypothetical protein
MATLTFFDEVTWNVICAYDVSATSTDVCDISSFQAWLSLLATALLMVYNFCCQEIFRQKVKMMLQVMGPG